MALVADTAAPAVPASRALAPAESGFVERGGVRVGYEVFGEGEQTLLLLPPWAIIHSLFWKLQVPYLARYFRVVTFDARGNGRSDRPQSAAEYGPRVSAADALEVLDAVGAEDCVLVAHCGIAAGALLLAAEHPERVRAAVFMSPALPITPARPERTGLPFNEVLPTDEGWAKANRHYWARDFPGYLEFFFGRCYTEPHSTKQLEDAIAWALETTPETLAFTLEAEALPEPLIHELLGRLTCPLLVTHGDQDMLIPADRGEKFAELTGAELLELEEVGHCPNARHPVPFNLAVRDFAERAFGRAPERPPWRRAIRRRRRALFVSSPIGLGHAWRDVAIARELRALEPELEIDWLAQDPVTRVLSACGERIHPASGLLSNESRHIAAESGEHELDVFQAWRRMDEILLANFMLFHDVASAERYDLWIGDEAWELDYYLHENPELKTAAYCFLTDFVGWLPLPEGGEDEARLTADYNADMIEQIARFPRVRDQAIFVGSPEDVIPEGFGEGLPAIRPWVEEHFDFSGYVLAPDAGRPPDRDALRAELGWGPDEHVCLVTRRWVWRRRATARARDRRPGGGAPQSAEPPHDRGLRPTHRPRRAARPRRTRGGRLRPRPLTAARGLRRRRGTGRPDDLHGAGGGKDAVPLLPPAAPLRAEPSRPPPPRALRSGHADGLRDRHPADDRRRDRRRARQHARARRSRA